MVLNNAKDNMSYCFLSTENVHEEIRKQTSERYVYIFLFQLTIRISLLSLSENKAFIMNAFPRIFECVISLLLISYRYTCTILV